MDIQNICRICLQKGNALLNMYTNLYAKKNILYSEMLCSCTKLKPYNGDGLPSTLCIECCKQLRKAYAFNKLCENSDKQLKSYLQELKTLSVKTGENLNLEDGLIEPKTEDINEKVINDSLDLIIFQQSIELPIRNGSIKLESDLNEDVNCWDADDDNILLDELRTKKLGTDEIIESVDDKDEINRESITNNGESDLNDADDDNTLLDELRTKKLGTDETIENVDSKDKKKRGRKKKNRGNEQEELHHQCDICGKFVTTKSNLKAHKSLHTNIRPYTCSDCPATFRGYSALYQHRKKHTGEKSYHCEYCPKRFSRRSGLVNHIRIHTGDKQYSCNICFKSFTQNAQLSVHLKRHKGEKSFLCQDCGKGFAIRADLLVHQRIHNGEKPYSCHLCEKTFATSGNLSIHIRIHNKEIRFTCKECKRGFVTSSSYNVHMKRHRGQRDHHCECGKTFYTSSALKQHKLVHTGEKKYQCKICDRKFSQAGHLKRHFKRDHAKSNTSLPSSDHYKIVLKRPEDKGWVNNTYPKKLAKEIFDSVKCDGN